MDLIDRKALLIQIEISPQNTFIRNTPLAMDLRKLYSNVIKLAPTVDAEPVRHGKIIETIKDGKYHREFSCCGRDFTQLTMWYIPRFCPNCGAKMDGE